MIGAVRSPNYLNRSGLGTALLNAALDDENIKDATHGTSCLIAHGSVSRGGDALASTANLPRNPPVRSTVLTIEWPDGRRV